jgi:hypothetical protein
MTTKWVGVSVFAKLVEASEQRVRAHCRQGATFGPACKRGPTGAWMLDQEAALKRWTTHRCLATASAEVWQKEFDRQRAASAPSAAPQIYESVPAPQFHVYESARGYLEVSHTDFLALLKATETPESEIPARLVPLVDRILWIVGIISQPVTPGENQ